MELLEFTDQFSLDHELRLLILRFQRHPCHSTADIYVAQTKHTGKFEPLEYKLGHDKVVRLAKRMYRLYGIICLVKSVSNHECCDNGRFAV